MLPFLMSFLFLGTPPSLLTVPITPVVEAAELSTSDLKQMATEIATEHNLNVSRFLATITLESNWDAHAVGDHGLSHGLAQLYYPTRDWGIATSSAYEPRVALEIMASAWDRGEAYRWSAYCILFGTPASKCPSELLR